MNLKLGDTQLIIDECRRQGLLRNQAAYVLATAYHESGHTMKPISEMGGLAYLQSKKYYPYYGRGYVQLTWDYNYKKAGAKLGVDFITHPELLLQAQYAVPILVTGMREGWFTGKSLTSYITLQSSDFVNARRIINGTDRAEMIAGYATSYDMDLASAGYGVDSPITAPVVVTQAIPVVPAVPQPATLVAPVQPPLAMPEPTAPLDHVPVVPSPAPKTLIDIILIIIKALFGGNK